ncbi:hypothetical protein ACLMJK_004333 [Lecanora helva]
MAMAPGPLIEPRDSLANAFSRQDHDTALACMYPNEQPPSYSINHDHYRPILSDSIIHGTNREKKSQPRPERRVTFDCESPENITPVNEAPIINTPALPLKKGLQIPSRLGVVTSGFKLPSILESQGVSKAEWKRFTHELKGNANLSGKQWAVFVPTAIGIGCFSYFRLGVVGFLPSTLIFYKLYKRREHKNFRNAHATGILESFCRRWNETYFEPLSLHVMIATPGIGDMQDMDVSSTKLFRLQQKMSDMPPTPEIASNRKLARYQMKEGYQRVKAAQKARIIVLPMHGSATHNSNVQQESGQVDIRDYFDRDESQNF